MQFHDFGTFFVLGFCLASFWAYLAGNFCPFLGALCDCVWLALLLHFSHFYNEFWFYAKSTQLEFISCSFCRCCSHLSIMRVLPSCIGTQFCSSNKKTKKNLNKITRRGKHRSSRMTERFPAWEKQNKPTHPLEKVEELVGERKRWGECSRLGVICI